jgi:hypothetical protein
MMRRLQAQQEAQLASPGHTVLCARSVRSHLTPAARSSLFSINSLRHQIEAACTPRMTPKQPMKTQIAAPQYAVFLQGLDGITRATGREAAILSEIGAKHQAIELKAGDQKFLHRALSCRQ